MSELNYAVPIIEEINGTFTNGFGFSTKEQILEMYNDTLKEGIVHLARLVAYFISVNGKMCKAIEMNYEEQILEELTNVELEAQLAKTIYLILEEATVVDERFQETLIQLRSDRAKVDAIFENMDNSIKTINTEVL